MSDNDVRLPLSECPVCLYEMDAATALEREKATPTPGDFSLCINCGALLVFEERSQLRQATDDDMEHLWPDQKEKIRIAQREIRRMQKERKHEQIRGWPGEKAVTTPPFWRGQSLWQK